MRASNGDDRWVHWFFGLTNLVGVGASAKDPKNVNTLYVGGGIAGFLLRTELEPIRFRIPLTGKERLIAGQSLL